ncbi:MAG: InlB B-repeat-containing protein [Spirochaetales bacterium]|nr:InlB B-repeat-containing protein [Spirochaetales bacterium]
MRKAFTIILSALLVLSVFISCSQEDLVDDLFNSKILVTFDANGGSGSMAEQEVKAKTLAVLNANTFTKEGYLFVEWNTKADGSGMAYADGASVALTENTTLYAQWLDASALILPTTTQLNNGTEYSIISDVTVTSRLVVNGTVTISLPADKTLTVPKGIKVAEGNSLTITGAGTLVIAETEAGKAGIGGDGNESCGTVEIKGGTINVTGGQSAAGIGGGRDGSGGTITISGGTVTAVGGNSAAGIGSGTGMYNEVNAGTITISGGTVNATGGASSAGIGGGANAGGGTITISGGTVNATGGSNVPGIGAGADGAAGTITISDEAKVTTAGGKLLVIFKANGGTGSMNPQAMSKNTSTALSANAFTCSGYVFAGWNTKADGNGTSYAAGASVTLDSDLVLYAQWADVSTITSATTAFTSDIGTYNLRDDVTIDTRVPVTGAVTINLAEGKTLTIPKGITVAAGNTLTIKGKGSLIITSPDEWDAGIGEDWKGSCGTVVIEGGTINVTGGENGAGIGGGMNGVGGTVIINGGNVTATGGDFGAGIGGGQGAAGGTVTINGGNVTATGGNYSAGIGGANSGAGGTVTINGGTVTATGSTESSGIGGGTMGAGGTVTINGGTVSATGGTDAPGIGAGKGGAAGTVTISDDANVTSIGGKVSALFMGNGADNSMAPQVMDKNTLTALSANTFKRIGYAFAGWNTKADGSGTAYDGGASVTLSEDIILYAQWVDASIITSSTTALDGDSVSEYKLLDDVTINSRVTVTGTVSINLAEGKTLEITKGIQVAEGNSLTIKGTGVMDSSAFEGNSAIGGNKNENCGTVIIEGGSIVARGAVGAAGIGGGKAETAGGNGGTITINGGEVWAMGAYGSPGIGSGTNNSGASVSGGNITITGGEVHVATGANSAVIGGGTNADSGTITINGGTVGILCDIVTTTIGAGLGGTNGDITISDDVNILSDGAGPGDDKVLVVFKANGGEGTIVPMIMNKNTETALSANTFTRTDYAFSSWNTKADGSGTTYADGASVSLDSDITLYAQWVDASIITSSTTELTSDIGDYKLLDNVTINSRVTVTGTVSINLAEGKTLTIPKGIQVSEGNSLTIKGKGRLLILETEDDNAGIGGNKDENCGTVIIEGGSIVAQGAFGAAGIGGGYAETAGGNGGTITINGGTVTAMGALGSPGIGSGTNESGASVSGGNITITGGTVHVATGSDSAAIGGGTNADSGTITISGGTVGILCDVVTTTIGAGLGGTNGDITISDDVNILSDGAGPGDDKVLVVFKANGGEGTIVPMIMNKNTETDLPANTFTKTDYFFKGWNTKADGTGTAYANGASVSLDSDITLYAQWWDGFTITSSTTAWTGDIGAFKLISNVTIDTRVTVTGTVLVNLAEGMTLSIPKGIRVSEGNSLTINGKGTLVINATEDENAGIGGNDGENCGTVIIQSGTVTVTGGLWGAGIGGGDEGSGGTITISGGTVIANGGVDAAGIGSGNYGSTAGTIEITGGNITAKGIAGTYGGAGIGGGFDSDGGTITISGGTVHATHGNNSPKSIGEGNGGSPGTVNISPSAEVTQD